MRLGFSNSLFSRKQNFTKKSNSFFYWGLFFLLMGYSVACFILFLVLVKIDSSFVLVLNLNLIRCFPMEISFPLVLDVISLGFSSVVCFISSWVIVYRGFYIRHETYIRRFLFLVFLFVIAINLLIFNPSIITLIVGWDGLGVISFLLVVYYIDRNSYSAGLITIFSNRVGDVFFIIFICLCCCDLDYQWFTSGFYSNYCLWGIRMCILLGRITKSAQIPFSAWLPAAMAAPTPVSTLVHSSTLVTAGVYVLIRFNYLFFGIIKTWLLILAFFTFFLAAVRGVYEADVKKVVALSTLRQVRIIIVALGLGMKMLSFYHLLVHAFFKALIFICVGALIFMRGGIQDIRFLSKFVSKSPLARRWLLISVLCLCGLPFISGFYSKDIIVEVGLRRVSGLFVRLIILFRISFTVIYSFRALILVFKNVEVGGYGFFHEEDKYLSSAICGLGVRALFGGKVLQCLFKERLVFVELLVFWKFCIIFFLILGWSLCYYVITRKNFIEKGLSYFKDYNRFIIKIFFLPFITGQWLGSSILGVISNLVKTVENIWVGKIFWMRRVGENFRVGSSKSRFLFFKPFNLFLGLFFVLVLFSLVVLI